MYDFVGQNSSHTDDIEDPFIYLENGILIN